MLTHTDIARSVSESAFSIYMAAFARAVEARVVAEVCVAYA
jgi:hypothetical protein